LRVKPTSPLKPSLRRYNAHVSEERRDALYDFWAKVISVYTTGNLSHEEDKLVAISRLATRFKGLLRDADYLAGLWKWNIVHQLLWETHPESVRGRTSSQRPKNYRAPSWSWASVDGEIFPWRPIGQAHSEYHVFAEVLDVNVTTVNNDPF
jgi:hypothetical protein